MDVLKLRVDKNGHWTHVLFNNKWYSIKGWVHTHPHAGTELSQTGVRMPSQEDFSLSKNRLPDLPAFVISQVETWAFSGTKNTYQKVGNTTDVLSGRIKLVNFK